MSERRSARGKHRPRRLRAIYFAPILALIAIGSWAFASPIGSSPDDDYHLISAWCAGVDQAGICESTGVAGERIVPEALVTLPCFAFRADVSASCQNVGDGLDSTVMVTSTRGSFLNNYPPVYYAFMHLFVSPNIVASALAMRLFNVLFFVGMVTGVAVLLPRALRSVLLWSSLVTMVPLGIFLIASNNPSSWALTGVMTSWIALMGFFRASGKRKIALGALFSIASILAAGARGDAAVFVTVGAAVACLLSLPVAWGSLKRLIFPAVVSIGALAFFLFSAQASVASTGLPPSSGLPSSSDVGIAAAPTRSAFATLVLNLVRLPSLWTGVFGYWKLGWLDTYLPELVWIPASAIFTGIVFLGISQMSRRKVIAFAGVGLLLVAVPLFVLQKSLTLVGQEVQPRYLLPLLILLAGVAVFRPDGVRFHVTGFQTTLVFLSLSAAAVLSLHVNMRRYISGFNKDSGISLNSSREWWWDTSVNPNVVWIIGAVAVVILIAILLAELNPAWRLRRRSNIAME